MAAGCWPLLAAAGRWPMAAVAGGRRWLAGSWLADFVRKITWKIRGRSKINFLRIAKASPMWSCWLLVFCAV